jgi:hypothetical protein
VHGFRILVRTTRRNCPRVFTPEALPVSQIGVESRGDLRAPFASNTVEVSPADNRPVDEPFSWIVIGVDPWIVDKNGESEPMASQVVGHACSL